MLNLKINFEDLLKIANKAKRNARFNTYAFMKGSNRASQFAYYLIVETLLLTEGEGTIKATERWIIDYTDNLIEQLHRGIREAKTEKSAEYLGTLLMFQEEVKCYINELDVEGA